jgi:hypothetical protein
MERKGLVARSSLQGNTGSKSANHELFVPCPGGRITTRMMDLRGTPQLACFWRERYLWTTVREPEPFWALGNKRGVAIVDECMIEEQTKDFRKSALRRKGAFSF